MMLAEMYGNVHIGLAFGGAAIGIGIACGGWRSWPSAATPVMFGRIFMVMLLGMAMAEGMAILAWIVIPGKPAYESTLALPRH